jgi:Icc-related predicted phosphoesterase
MKITFISDTHGKHQSMTDDLVGGPMIIHAGDISNTGTVGQINQFLEWFAELPYMHKVFIAGNHDFGFEKVRKSYEPGIVIPDGVTYLQDQSVMIEGIKIYGSPWQPRFYDWAFNLNRGEEIAKYWNMIPDDTDILVTHGPPFSVLDRTNRGDVVGCEDLYMRVKNVNPKIHVFGHIHEGYGVREIGDTIFINASSLDARYQYRNNPIILEYEKEISFDNIT